ncbi:MAG: hypothetical protein U0821_24150 [Chloroflexota bacterium]
MPEDLLTAIIDPTAPIPTWWPTGLWGTFLLFLIPVGGGIPSGVLMARDADAPIVLTALLYLISDVVQAVLAEPQLLILAALGRRVTVLGRLGQWFMRASETTGLNDGGRRGPLRLILVSFAIDPFTGRAAAAASGHGFVSGWTLAIAGDMIYFAVLAASTLWLSAILGDERMTVGAVLLIMVFGPRLVQRLVSAWQATPTITPVEPLAVVATSAARAPGRRSNRSRRRGRRG